MLSLGQFLIQTPEDLDNVQSSSSDGIREITTRRRDGTDDSDGTFSVRGTDTSNSTGSFVELSQLGGQVSGITGIGGHFSKTTRDFSQGFGPSGGGVSHHRNIITHISEVFSQGDTSVDGSFSGSDGHVGGISDQASSLHDIFFLSFNDGGKFGEFVQDFSHFVTSFTTTDVDNDF